MRCADDSRTLTSKMPSTTRTRTDPPKTQRLDARVSPGDKELFSNAAAALGLNLSEFITTTLRRAAAEVLQEQEIMRLTRRDAEVFLEAMAHPPRPKPKLQAAAKRYLRMLGE